MNIKLRSASEAQRAISSFIDGSLSLILGFISTAGVSIGLDGGLRWSEPQFWLKALGITLAISFLNHVILTASGLASVGKIVTWTRIVREDDGSYPGFLHMIRRWLWGFYWMIIIVPISIASLSDVNQEDMAGLKVVRR